MICMQKYVKTGTSKFEKFGNNILHFSNDNFDIEILLLCFLKNEQCTIVLQYIAMTTNFLLNYSIYLITMLFVSN